MVKNEVIMKHQIINDAMLLILIGCLAIPAVWAGYEDKTTVALPTSIPGVAQSNGLNEDDTGFQVKVSEATRLGFKSTGRWFLGQVVNLDLYAYNLQDLRKFRLDVKYNPQQLRLIHVSRGLFLVEDQDLAEWKSGVINNQNGLAADIFGIRNQSFSGKETTLLRLNFIVTDAGSGTVTLENPKIVSSNGIERAFNFTPLEYRIESYEF